MLAAHTRIIPIHPLNQVKTITKLANGDLWVEQNSGETFTVAKEDETFQVFVVYSVLAGGF